VDRILLVHDVEFCEFLQPSLQEIWRVLKSTGRLLVVVPNRNGLWSRAEWSPFGQGTPYSASQIEYYLRDNLFVHERTEGALYLPPIRHSAIQKSAGFFEKFGRTCPVMPGVIIVEATKQIYATPIQGGGIRTPARGRRLLIPKPAIQQFKTQD
jgi:SAM-dependent methyltransferase